MKADQKKEEILLGAARLFRRKTFSKTTIDDLAVSLKINKATIYYYFKDKTDLLYWIMCSSTDEYLKQVKSVIATSVLPPEKLEALVKTHINYATNYNNSFAGISYFEMKNLPRRLAKSYILKRDEYEHFLFEIIQEGTLMGYFRENDPSMTARFILGLLNSVIVWFRESGPLSSNQVAEEIWKFIARSICLHYEPRDADSPQMINLNIQGGGAGW
jgi:AcrR family transcriptional regulator